MNIKHSYFSIILHSENWHLFAFSISEIEQLQSTCMLQESWSADFTMMKLMNIILDSISKPQSKFSLMHSKFLDSAPITFYMNDLFSSHSNFESQFAFLWDQFFPQIEWVKLTLSFKKFHLFVSHIKALSIEHHVSRRVYVLLTQVKAVTKWLKLSNIKEVWNFLKAIDIICCWVKNFTEITQSLTWFTESVSWRWTLLKQLFFKIL